MKYRHTEVLISILYDFVDSTLTVHCMHVTHPTGPKCIYRRLIYYSQTSVIRAAWDRGVPVSKKCP